MKKKNDETKEVIQRIHDYALEEIMGDRFASYAKEIIQDRALPDVRDGLKPVQRRILYGMYESKNTYDKKYRKSAKAVGEIMGNYHPHGDSSIYDAMVRMSQDWKMMTPYIDMHGNNGSMDGDQAAAYRYTEAKLAHISKELLGDLEKDTVKWAPNFDDRFLEPTVLPAKFPNLLVNGANGISAGYATNIPPHNLGEIIDATIKRIDSPNCRLDTILEIVKGPDFPTGAIVEGKQGIIDAFTTGRGKVIVKSKTEFKKEKGREQIIITEIPFDVNKATLVQKIDSLRIDKKIDGISEVRDETDREGLRIAIDLKSGANKEFILNYLLKNTDLQISYNYNMVAIVNRTPKTLGIIPILDAYIDHFTEVITNRTKFDLAAYQKEFNIVSGLIKAISILDEVIKTIRSSKNKSDAKVNLVEKYDFTIEQAEAIVMLQLYKLTNTDVVVLEERSEKLKELIKECEKILNDENELKSVMKSELREIKKQYATPRKTEIKSEITEIKIDELDMISKDDFIVCISKTGYVKKISLKSYNSSNTQELPAVKENDYIEGFYKINNIDTIILFTNLGNFLYLPVRDIQEAKYKDLGTHISNYIKVSDDEKIIRSIGVDKFDDTLITAVTKNGMIKKMRLKEFAVSRYSKPITMFKLKDDDEVVSVSNNSGKDTVIVTNSGYALRFNTDEIPEFGLKAGGVKAIKLSDDDVVSSAFVISENKEYLAIFTDKNTAKRIKVEDIEMSSRAKKGSLIIKSPKSKKYSIFKAFNISSKSIVGIVDGSIGYLKSSDINIMDKQSVGSVITKKNIDNIFVVTKLKEIKSSELKEKETKKETSDEVKPKEEKQLTMSDFFEEFKI